MKEGLISTERIADPVKYKSYSHLIKIALNLCISSFFNGYGFGSVNTIDTRELVRIYEVDVEPSLIQGLITAVLAFSAAFGSWSGKYFLERYSRRYPLPKLTIENAFYSLTKLSC